MALLWGSVLDRLKGVDRRSLKRRGTLVQLVSFKLCVFTESVRGWWGNDSRLVSLNSSARFGLAWSFSTTRGLEDLTPRQPSIFYFYPINIIYFYPINIMKFKSLQTPQLTDTAAALSDSTCYHTFTS